VDLGEPMRISSVWLHWERAYARKYQLQAKVDDEWTEIVIEEDSDGEVDVPDVHDKDKETQFVRLQCIERARGYGNSLFKFEVRGTPAACYKSLRVVAST
jgi:hypothetical protein